MSETATFNKLRGYELSADEVQVIHAFGANSVFDYCKDNNVNLNYVDGVYTFLFPTEEERNFFAEFILKN